MIGDILKIKIKDQRGAVSFYLYMLGAVLVLAAIAGICYWLWKMIMTL